MRFWTICIAASLLASPSLAAMNPDEMLADPALEQRARDLSKELRCLVCQNQSIDDSDAELAQDLRRVVRERIEAGYEDQEIRDYLVDRYGDFVLLTPPIRPSTWLLWFGPVFVLLAGSLMLWRFIAGSRRATLGSEAPLQDDEQRILADLLDQSAGDKPVR